MGNVFHRDSAEVWQGIGVPRSSKYFGGRSALLAGRQGTIEST